MPRRSAGGSCAPSRIRSHLPAARRDRVPAWSSVASPAVLGRIEVPWRVDVPLVAVGHVRHLSDGADVIAVSLFRLDVAMALETPPHAEGLLHAHLLHLVDAPV